jgi:hypothetical protein
MTSKLTCVTVWQTKRIVTIAKRLVCPSAELGKPLSRNDLKQMIREGKVRRPHIALTD